MKELPQWSHAIFSILIFCAIALCVIFRGIAFLDPLLFVLPGSLLALSYLSLNGSSLFLDLYLPSALGLAFLALLRFWNSLRRNYWLGWFDEDGAALTDGPMGIASVLGRAPWVGINCDKLMDGLAKFMPDCRLITSDANARWPAELKWPELAIHASVVGPKTQLAQGLAQFIHTLGDNISLHGEIVDMPMGCTREVAADCALKDWAILR